MSRPYRPGRGQTTTGGQNGLHLNGGYELLNRALRFFHDVSLSNVDAANGMSDALARLSAHRSTVANFQHFLIIGGTASTNPLDRKFYYVETFTGEANPVTLTNNIYTVTTAGHYDNGAAVVFTPEKNWSRTVDQTRVFNDTQSLDGQAPTNGGIALRVTAETRAITAGNALRMANVPIASGANVNGFAGPYGLGTGTQFGGDAAFVSL